MTGEQLFSYQTPCVFGNYWEKRRVRWALSAVHPIYACALASSLGPGPFPFPAFHMLRVNLRGCMRVHDSMAAWHQTWNLIWQEEKACVHAHTPYSKPLASMDMPHCLRVHTRPVVLSIQIPYSGFNYALSDTVPLPCSDKNLYCSIHQSTMLYLSLGKTHSVY